MDGELNQQKLRSAFDAFWLAPCDLRALTLLRRAYGFLLVLNTLCLWPDRHLFFGKESLLPRDASRAILDKDAFNLYSFFPDAPATITVALLILLGFGVLLITEVLPRVSAAVCFLCLVLVSHANIMLFDGQDTVFRLFAFYLIFVPPLRLLTPIRNRSGETNQQTFPYPAWPKRLIQIQLCAIYFCTALQKADGAAWLDGWAVYYVLRLDDFTGFQLPSMITESGILILLATWSVILFEFFTPFLIWWSKTRFLTLIAATIFHLSADLMFNLHCFHWLMIVGLMSFIEYENVVTLFSNLKNMFRRQTPCHVESKTEST